MKSIECSNRLVFFQKNIFLFYSVVFIFSCYGVLYSQKVNKVIKEQKKFYKVNKLYQLNIN